MSSLRLPDIKFAGFTLLELLVVITILGMLAVAIIPRLSHYPDRAKITATHAMIDISRSAIDRFVLANHAKENDGRFPTYTQFNTPGVVLHEPMLPNPYNGSAEICNADNAWIDSNPPINVNETCTGYGWNYDQTHGKFWANSNQNNEHLY